MRRQISDALVNRNKERNESSPSACQSDGPNENGSALSKGFLGHSERRSGGLWGELSQKTWTIHQVCETYFVSPNEMQWLGCSPEQGRSLDAPLKDRRSRRMGSRTNRPFIMSSPEDFPQKPTSVRSLRANVPYCDDSNHSSPLVGYCLYLLTHCLACGSSQEGLERLRTIKSMGCSSRSPEFNFQHPPITVVPWDPMPSSGVQMYVQTKTTVYIKYIVSLFKKEFVWPSNKILVELSMYQIVE